MKPMSRALRRHHAQRMKTKAKAVTYNGDIKVADHLAACSCMLCGNPRKWYGTKTLQEIKADQAFKDDLNA